MATIYLNDKTLGELKSRGVNPSGICNKLAKEYLHSDFQYNKRLALKEFNLALENIRHYYIAEVELSEPK